jgi:hypothetical protein
MGLINSNLPSDSQPWGRDIEDRLTTVEGSLATSEVNNNARDAQLQTNINAVSNSLNQVSTSSVSQHKRQDFGDGVFYSRPVILSFQKPSWANTATINSVVQVDALAQYSGVANAITGTAGIFINDVLSTYEMYILNNPIPNTPVIRDNTKSMTLIPSASITQIYRSITIVDSEQIRFEGDVLNVWGVFQAYQPLTNEIPPNDYNDWTAAQILQWNVGVNTNSGFSIDISSTVTWSAQ